MTITCIGSHFTTHRLYSLDIYSTVNIYSVLTVCNCTGFHSDLDIGVYLNQNFVQTRSAFIAAKKSVSNTT